MKQFRAAANGHKRFGSRHTRKMSKLGVKPMDGARLEYLLKQDKEQRRGTDR